MKRTTLSFLLLIYAAAVWAQGAYVEFRVTTSQTGPAGSSKIYYRDGNTRAEISLNSQQASGHTDHVSLILKDSANKAFILNQTDMTYTTIDLTNVTKTDNDPSQYLITVIGKEMVNGYLCTHIRMKRVTSKTDEDVWISLNVPNYKQFMNIKSKYTSMGFFKAIAAKGVAGFPVRMVLPENGHNIQVDLAKSEVKDIPASLFSLKGYKRGAAPMQGPEDVMNKIKSMTPEERKKFLDEVRKNQQKHDTTGSKK